MEKEEQRKEEQRKEEQRKEEREDRNGTKKIYACWLCCVPGIGSRTMEKLLALCPDPEEIYRRGEELWKQVLSQRQREQIRNYAGRITPEELWEKMVRRGIGFVALPDTEYPRRLREIPDAPWGMFFRGRLPDGDRPAVAVIGARDCSGYGEFVAGEIGKSLGAMGVQVISGMARGIDGISQAAALRAGGASFGVLGCGVDICYPASNRELYESLCERGGLLSAYPPGTEPRPGHFPPRNRIVSGLADAVVVVEAGDKSGTLITVDMALEQGREVYAVPGRVTDRLSGGCNRLIRQGAGVFLDPEDFLQELAENWVISVKARGKEESRDTAGQDEGQRAICRVLDVSPMSVEQIRARLPGERTLPELTAGLMALCVRGIARQVSPGQFALNPAGGK